MQIPTGAEKGVAGAEEDGAVEAMVVEDMEDMEAGVVVDMEAEAGEEKVVDGAVASGFFSSPESPIEEVCIWIWTSTIVDEMCL